MKTLRSKKETVSIAMCTYNGGKYLQAQLNSFNSQTRLPDELIVCDDVSTDDTLDLLRKFKKKAKFDVKVYFNPENIGFTKNFEKSLSLCNGDFIFLSDQDDVWDKKKISTILSHHVNNPQRHVFIHDALYTDENLNSSNITVIQKLLSISGDKNSHINGACTAMTSSFRNFIVPFPDNNHAAHDGYIHRWANLLKCKCIVNDVLQKWRIHGDNSTCNDMGSPKITSTYEQFSRYKNADLRTAYLNKIDDFIAIRHLFLERSDHFRIANFNVPLDDVLKAIDGHIDANSHRAELSKLDWYHRNKLILGMFYSGQYQYFHGFKSFIKDLIVHNIKKSV